MTPRFNTPSPSGEETSSKSNSPTGAEKFSAPASVAPISPVHGSFGQRATGGPVVAGAAAESQQFSQLRRSDAVGSLPTLCTALPCGLVGAGSSFPVFHRSVSGSLGLGSLVALTSTSSLCLTASLGGSPTPLASSEALLVATPTAPRKSVGAVLAPLFEEASSSLGEAPVGGATNDGGGGGLIEHDAVVLRVLDEATADGTPADDEGHAAEEDYKSWLADVF